MLNIVASRLDPSKYQEYALLTEHTRYGLNLHPIWWATYIESFGYRRKELILEARDDRGKLCGLLPLVQKEDRLSRFMEIRRLVPLGYRPTDFFDIISMPEKEREVTKALAKWLKKNSRSWDQLMINLIPHENTSWRPFVEQLQETGFNPEVITDRAFLKIETTQPYERYLEGLGTKKQKEIRYYTNKLQRMGESVKVEHITSDLEQHYDGFMRIYDDRRVSQSQSNPFTRAHMPQYRFMKALISQYEQHNWIRLSVLKLGRTCIAWAYNFIYGHVNYYSMPTFLEAYKSYSPGNLLLMALIKDAFEDPDIHEFNFMRSEQPYKLWFNPDRELYVTIKVDNPWSYRNRLLPALSSLSSIKSKFVRRVS